MYRYVIVDDRGGPVTVFTLNRPDKLNALGGPELRAELLDALRRFNADPGKRVGGVLTGAGRAFSSGAEISVKPVVLGGLWILRVSLGIHFT